MLNPLFALFLPMMLSFSTVLSTPSTSETVQVEAEKKEENNNFDAALYASGGLLVVGGAGSIIIYNNNKNRKMNTPIEDKKEKRSKASED